MYTYIINYMNFLRASYIPTYRPMFDELRWLLLEVAYILNSSL